MLRISTRFCNYDVRWRNIITRPSEYYPSPHDHNPAAQYMHRGEGGGGLRRGREICVFNAPPSQHKNFKNTPSYGMFVAHPCNIISKFISMYDFA